MLYATLPSAHRPNLIEKMCRHPSLDGVRYNVGIRTSYTPEDVLLYLKRVTANKELWIDLKGRQIRINKWADPTYGDIELDHEVEVDLPAKIYFRGGQWCKLVDINGRNIFVEPDPQEALGAGQAINIIGDNLNIKGDYLTEIDKQHVLAAKKLGIHNYMLSFVEQESDIEMVRKLDPEANLILKIESQKGLDFVPLTKDRLMAARDDLFINIGENKGDIVKALKLIISHDPNALAASGLFTSERLTIADVSDLMFLNEMGYKHFVLSDDVSHNKFDISMEKFEMMKKCFS